MTEPTAADAEVADGAARYLAGMIEEAGQLSGRLHRLGRFIEDGPIHRLDAIDRSLMHEQEQAMRAYLVSLSARIGRESAGANVYATGVAEKSPEPADCDDVYVTDAPEVSA